MVNVAKRIGPAAVLAAVGCLAVGAASPTAGQPAEEGALTVKLTWQVEHPFRYLKYRSDLEIHELAFEELSEQERAHAPISNTERRLNNPVWWTQERLSQLRQLRADEGRGTNFEPRLGWASLLVNEGATIVSGTCYSAAEQDHRNCTNGAAADDGNLYIQPNRHLIVIEVATDATTEASDATVEARDVICRLEIDAPARLVQAPRRAARPRSQGQFVDLEDCAGQVFAEIPYQGNKAADDAPAPVTARVVQEGTLIAETKIHVKDLLIVGMGDSFSSGEGNPERPATLSTRGGYFGDDGRIVPRRHPYNGHSAAAWTDRRCHRSIYSYQARVALALSLHGERHHAVTFVHTACSGAEILDGMFLDREGREPIKRTGRHITDQTSQINRLIYELCPSVNPQMANFRKFKGKDYRLYRCKFVRDIDLLMLSIGGNDVGFSSLVAKATLKDGSIDIISEFPGALPHGTTAEDAYKKAEDLPDLFSLLNDAIGTKLEFDGQANKSNVLYMVYPTLAFDEDEALCPPGTETMDVSTAYELSAGDDGQTELVALDAFIESSNGEKEALVPILRRLASKYGWTIVDGHRAMFRKHGFCAKRSSTDPNESGTKTAEARRMPTFDLTTNTWTRFRPAHDFYPYESRQRWFRTLNDDFKIIQFAKRALPTFDKGSERTVRPKEVLDLDGGNEFQLALLAAGGAYHPTAEGHAHIADFVYCKAVETLFGVACDETAVAEFATE